MKGLSTKLFLSAGFFLWIFIAEAHASVPQWSQSKAAIATRGGDGKDDDSLFEILDETVAYSRWRTITQRKVRMRNGNVVDFDLVGVKTGPGAVLVFAWDTKTKTATLIREYMPASHKILWGVGAGLIEKKHGEDPIVAGQHELEEECHLTGGTWILLTEAPCAMDKYSLTKVTAYLVLDPEPAIDPKPLDEEEDIEIVPGVSAEEIMAYIRDGEMNLVGGWGCMLALAKLRELDLL
eukprot:scaffold4157_cov136-Cylindrotheca_fusiformis.AAC.12